MAKNLNKWLDEFVEKGADPSDVTDWPENAGGGGTYPGAIQVEALPERGKNNAIYQLPNGDVYKCNIRKEKHLHVGEYYKFATAITKADYDAFWAKLPSRLEYYQLENPEHEESSNTDMIVYINFIRSGDNALYYETVPAVEFEGYGIGSPSSLTQGAFVVDAQANVSYPTRKEEEQGREYINNWNAEYEAPISEYLSDAITSSSLGLTLDDFVPFFNVPTETVCTYEVIEQKSTLKSNALPEVGVPNTVFEVTPLVTQIYESEDGNDLPVQSFSDNNLMIFETAEEALAYMNGKPIQVRHPNDIAWATSDNKLFSYDFATLTTVVEVPQYIQDGKVIKGVFALTAEDPKFHVQRTTIFSFVNRAISTEFSELPGNPRVTIESLDKETVVLNRDYSVNVNFVAFWKLGGEAEHFIYKDEFINLNDVQSIYPLMKIANGAKVKIDFSYESYNINSSEMITGFDELEEDSYGDKICVGEDVPYGFYLQKNEAQTQITATLFFGYSYQEISQTIVIYEGDVSSIDNTSNILNSLPTVEFEVSGLPDGNFAVIKPRSSIVF